MATKKDQGFLLDSEGKPVQSSSGPVRSGSYDDPKVTENRMEAAREQLAQDVQNKLKADKSKVDAEQGSQAPSTSLAKMPARPGQSKPKAKSGVVTKEELEKSGLSLRDYMNKQKGLTRRDGKAPAKAPSKAQSAESAKSDFLASQRKRSDLIRDLTKAEREAPAETSALAKQKIAEAKRKAVEDYGYASEAENRKGYVPRATPGARAPKQTTSKAKPYMPERPNMSFAKGGSVSSASKRADGIATKGKTRCKVY